MLALAGVLAGALTVAADLKPETVAAFDHYVRVTDARVDAESRGGGGFLRLDQLPPSDRTRQVAAVRNGGVHIERIESRDNGSTIPVPSGLVHHWLGVVFAPGATLQESVTLLQDYDRHDEIYAPAITDARLLSRRGDEFTFTMRFVVRSVLTAVLKTDQTARFFFPAPDRAHSRIVSTRIVEVADAGSAHESEKPEGHDRGYLWRMTSYWRFLERDGGMYVQCESISLSRGLPAGLGWIFGRAVRGVPRDTLVYTLAQTRKTLAK
jgi:hypothetical protein